MKASRRAAIGAATIGVLLHTLTVLWAWRNWGIIGRGNVIAWLDFPASLGYMQLDGNPLLFWSLLAGGLQWGAIAALVAFVVGRAARRDG